LELIGIDHILKIDQEINIIDEWKVMITSYILYVCQNSVLERNLEGETYA